MSQAWPPLERSRPDLRLRSLNVVASLHSEDEKATELGGGVFGRRLDERAPKYGRRRSDLASTTHTTLDLIVFIHVWARAHPSAAQTSSGALARP